MTIETQDVIKLETARGETHYGHVIDTQHGGKHVFVCLDDEEKSKARFERERLLHTGPVQHVIDDSLEQPSPLVTVPSIVSGGTEEIIDI